MLQEQRPPRSKQTPPPQTAPLDLSAADDFQALNQARESGLLSRLGSSFNQALQKNRGSSHSGPVAQAMTQRSVDEVALARARNTRAPKMYIPEGVIIEGSLTGGSETEIHGRIEGNVSIDGALYLGKKALVTGNIRAGACQIEGMVEGKVECSDGLYLTATGRLSADVVAGKQIRLAGQVRGNVSTPGALRIESGGVVNGDIKARVFSMDEGAVLNGRCVMRPPAQQSEDKARAAKDNTQ